MKFYLQQSHHSLLFVSCPVSDIYLSHDTIRTEVRSQTENRYSLGNTEKSKQRRSTDMFKAAYPQAALLTAAPRRASTPFPDQSLIHYIKAPKNGHKTASLSSQLEGSGYQGI